MWYFAWILGLGLAVAFAILNGLWHELRSAET
ncbi:MAG: cytochrome bd-I oxidase subunit CydX [Pseudomonadota bacterium]